jgi:hypothetical protein
VVGSRGSFFRSVRCRAAAPARRPPRALQPVQALQCPAHPLVGRQPLPVALEEGPVAGRERAGVVAESLPRVVAAAAAVVAHPVDVGAAGRVGLGGQRPPSACWLMPTTLAPSPSRSRRRSCGGTSRSSPRVDAALQRVVAEHHQPRDVVHPAVARAGRQTSETGRAVIGRRRGGPAPAGPWLAEGLRAGSPGRGASTCARCSPPPHTCGRSPRRCWRQRVPRHGEAAVRPRRRARPSSGSSSPRFMRRGEQRVGQPPSCASIASSWGPKAQPGVGKSRSRCSASRG